MLNNKNKIIDYLSQREIKILKNFSKLQLDILNENSSTKVNIVSFDYEGIQILNPFIDETGSYEVDPVAYYGKLFLNSDFLKLFN